MINKLPLIGWIISFISSASLSVPFWICWTVCNIGETYFYFVPKVYQSIQFWDCVGLFVVLGILKGLLTFKLVSVSQTVNKEGNK
jgi:hypothetical protein